MYVIAYSVKEIYAQCNVEEKVHHHRHRYCHHHAHYQHQCQKRNFVEISIPSESQVCKHL